MFTVAEGGGGKERGEAPPCVSNCGRGNATWTMRAGASVSSVCAKQSGAGGVEDSSSTPTSHHVDQPEDRVPSSRSL